MPEKSQSKRKKRNDTVTHRRLSDGSGRHQNQKMKASVLYQYFLRHTDENHVSSIEAIKDYLGIEFELDLERRSLYHDEHQQMQIYSIDRMMNVSLTGEKRTGEEVFAAMDLTEYYLSDFRSYEASRRMVTIRFANSALEAVVERFGSTGKVRRIDSEYFEVTAHVETNSQFYNWLLTFGTEAKILKPEWAAEAFLKYIDDIRNTYTTKP